MLHIDTTPEGYSYKPLLKSDTIVVGGLKGTSFNLCSLGIVPEGQSGRKVMGGPEVPGPWGFATTHALIIDCHGGSTAERDRAIRVEVGQPFTVSGLPGTWMFRSPDRRKCEGDGAVLVEYEAGA